LGEANGLNEPSPAWSEIVIPGIATLGGNDATGVNLGGVYDFSSTYHLLFSLLFSFGRAFDTALTSGMLFFYTALRLTY
jgi:hypothetical protein